MTIQELLQLLGSKEVDLYLARKQIAELQAEVAQAQQLREAQEAQAAACSEPKKSVK